MTNCNLNGLMRASVAAFAAAALLLAVADDAAALIVHGDVGSSSTPSANLSAPTGGQGDPGWDNVGWGGTGTTSGSAGTAVYLGNGWVLTANHTKSGSIRLGTDDPSGGTTYSIITGSGFRLKNPDNSDSELWMYRIHGDPGLPTLNIAQTSPTIGDDAIVIGTGVTRGSALKNYNFGASGLVQGYDWGTARDKAWGATQVSTNSMLASYGGLPTSYTFESDFDVLISSAAAGADKDSGSAMFIYNDDLSQWELAGIMIAVTSTYQTTGGTVFSQFGNTSIDPSAIVAVDLAPYHDQIVAVIPEPGSLTLLGLGALGLLRAAVGGETTAALFELRLRRIVACRERQLGPFNPRRAAPLLTERIAHANPVFLLQPGFASRRVNRRAEPTAAARIISTRSGSKTSSA